MRQHKSRNRPRPLEEGIKWVKSLAILVVVASVAFGQALKPRFPEGTHELAQQAFPGGAPSPLQNSPALDRPPQTLRVAARGRFLIGTAIMSRQLDDPKLATLVAEQFDCLTAENELKPRSLQPRQKEFHFAAGDKLVEFAQRHGMKVVGHTLCWHNQSPAWLFTSPAGKPLSREEALRNLKGHIEGVVGHFKGKVLGWDVVNEAIGNAKEDYLRDTPARRAIGADYIVKAFEFAHAADPEAELYYNDYGIENLEKRQKAIRLIRDLKAHGVRIDAVGIQSHLRLEETDAPDRLDQAIAAFAAEGVKVAISELDIDVLPRRQRGADVAARENGGSDPYKNGLPAEVAEAQARLYRRIFQVVLKHRGALTRVSFWGTHDGGSWLNFWPAGRRTNHPLLWNRALQPKPAFEAVLEELAAP